MAYQDIPRFSPNYGNRYGFRQQPAPSVSPFNQPVPQSPTASSSDTRINDYSGTSAETPGQTLDQGDDSGPSAEDYRGQASTDLGYEYGQATPGQIASGLFGLAGLGAVGTLAQTGLDKAGVFGGIPEHQRYGAPGTADIVSGGVFNNQGRAIDPITGQALGSYGNKSDFYGGSYIQGIKDNPFSIDSYLGDPDNAPSYTAANAARARGSNAALGFEAALANPDSLLGGLEEDDITESDRARVAQHIAVTEHGIQPHSAEEGSATNQAIQGIGYSDTGAAPAGSQFSSTGTFSSGNQDDNNDNDSGIGSDTFNDAGGSYVGDDPSTYDDDGGGGGGGK